MAKAVKKKPANKKPAPKKAVAKKKVSPKKPAPVKKASVVKKSVVKKVVEPKMSPEAQAPEEAIAPAVPKPQMHVIKRSVSTPSPAVAAEASKAVLKPVVTQTPAPTHQKVGWTNLPNGFPAQIKFLTQMAERECSAIENVPFSFAKFIYSLPKDICGLQFGLLLLALEHDEESISRLCRMDREKVSELVSLGREALQEKFSTMCGDLERKWSGYRKESGRSIESVVEPYLVSKMDRNLQLLVGAVLLNR